MENSGDGNGFNNNNSNNNNGNWNKNRNRRNFNQGGNFNYDQNKNYGNYNQFGNFNPNFNPNNFSNGGYNNNPNRYLPQVPMNYNQGWNQMPYGNPSQGIPTYVGQNPRWANNQRRIAYKVTTQFTMFQQVYGQEAILPIEFEIPSFRIAIENRLGEADSLQDRLTKLEALDETRKIAYLNNYAI